MDLVIHMFLLTYIPNFVELYQMTFPHIVGEMLYQETLLTSTTFMLPLEK